MPIYEYECEVCNIRVEARQGFNDPPPTKECEKDEGEKCKLHKVISKSSFALKGSGWYKDGY